jgi:hypothetical protein
MHYHIHVLRGKSQRFVRGLTVVQSGESTDASAASFEVWDDMGEFGEAGRPLSEPLPLAEALRRALAITAQHITEPFEPLPGSAPFELLGYGKPRRIGRRWLLFPRYEKLPDDANHVGPDGLPKHPSALPP